MATGNTIELFIKARDEASAKLSKISSVTNGAALAFKAVSVAATATVGALTTAALRAGSVGDKFEKMSHRVGVSTKDLSQLAFAARQSGSSIETVENSFRVLSKQMDNASLGNKTAKQAFDSLGISVQDASGQLRNKMDVLKEAATKMSALDNETEKAAIAGKLFGERYGTQLLPLLNQGAEGIEDLMDRADELGSTVDTVAAQEAAAFQDAMDEATTAMDGLWRTIGQKILPIMVPLMKQFADAVAATIDWVKESDRLQDALLAVRNMLGLQKTTADIYKETLKSMTREELKSIIKTKDAAMEAMKERRLKGGQFRTQEEAAKFHTLAQDKKLHEEELALREKEIKSEEEGAKIREIQRQVRAQQRAAEREEKKKEKEEEHEEDLEQELSWEEETQQMMQDIDDRFAEESQKKLLERLQKEKAEKDKAAEAEKKRQQAVEDFKVNIAGETAGMLAAFGLQNTIAYKAFATAQTIMNTAVSVMAAMKLGFPFGPIKAGLVTAMGAAQIAKISGAKFHDGGLVGGAGEVPALLQSGEFVMRREAVQQTGVENLAAINEGNNAANVNVVNFIDTDALDNYLNSHKGQRAIVNALEF